MTLKNRSRSLTFNKTTEFYEIHLWSKQHDSVSHTLRDMASMITIGFNRTNTEKSLKIRIIKKVKSILKDNSNVWKK